jgi:tetratricopeptide (TPR) repeat protein
MGRLSAADFVTAGDRFRLGRDWQRAADSYYRALLLKPESSAVWYGLGEVHQAREDTDAALDAYTRVLDLSGDAQLAAAAHSRRGKILADARRWAEASAELSQALALAPGEGLYYLEHGWYAYKAGGSLGEARAELKKAATLLPHDAWPHIRLADLASVEGDHAEMLVRARQAVALQPGLFWGWLLQGQALRHLGRLDEAEEALCHAVELAPEKAVLHWELGHLMRQAARMEEAIAEYQQAVELAPDNVWYHLSLADAYRSNARISEAVEVYQRVLELRPGNTAAQEALQELGH